MGRFRCRSSSDAQAFGCDVGGPASAEWIKYDFAGIGGDFNTTFGNRWFQLVDVPPGFIFAVPGGRGVFPEIREIQTCQVQKFAVAIVILDIFSAIPAGRNWQAHSFKVFGFPLVKYKSA